jgi:hypothetical protein
LLQQCVNNLTDKNAILKSTVTANSKDVNKIDESISQFQKALDLVKINFGNVKGLTFVAYAREYTTF